MAMIEPGAVKQDYDCIVVGSGLGSLFFLQRYLQRNPKARVAVIEWGKFRDRDWQMETMANSDIPLDGAHRKTSPSHKPWDYSIGYGGGLNCWWALTPRFQPNDFRVRSLYGYSVDWPIGYDDLADYYTQAERTMEVSGPEDIGAIFPGHPGYPLPPHRLATPDIAMKKAMPDRHFAYPNAKASKATEARGACCSASRCGFCPTNARFSWYNGLPAFHEDERVDLLVECKVERVLTTGDVATGVVFSNNGKDYTTTGELIVLGANAIHSAFILQRSGFSDWALGRFLHEKMTGKAEVFLDGMKNFDGGSSNTGLNTSLWDGPHRKTQPATIILNPNRWIFYLRNEANKWTETFPVGLYIEDIPQENNRVIDDGGDLPLVDHPAYSDFSTAAIPKIVEQLTDVFAPLPLAGPFKTFEFIPTISHVMGTARMGDDPKTNVVDRNCVHHRVRNLALVGTSVFPSCGVANPSLTIAALSYRLADHLAARA